MPQLRILFDLRGLPDPKSASSQPSMQSRISPAFAPLDCHSLRHKKVDHEICLSWRSDSVGEPSVLFSVAESMQARWAVAKVHGRRGPLAGV